MTKRKRSSYAFKKRSKRRYNKRRYVKRRTKVSRTFKKKVKKVVNSLAEKKHLDRDLRITDPGNYFIRPWGLAGDNASSTGQLFGDTPVRNPLDLIIDEALGPPPGVANRDGAQIHLSSMKINLRIECNEFTPASTPASLSINNQSSLMQSKLCLMLLHDPEAQQGLQLGAGTGTGTLNDIFDSVAIVATNRHLPKFKQYEKHRFKVIYKKNIYVNGQRNGFKDVSAHVKINRKVNYVPSSSTSMAGYYWFIYSDFPALATVPGLVLGPRLTYAKCRYYYTDM